MPYSKKTMKDVESNSSQSEDSSLADIDLLRSTTGSTCWKLLLAAAFACFLGSHALSASSETIQTLQSGSKNSLTTTTTNIRENSLGWHIKPIHPHHDGRVVYLAEETSGGILYKRIFTVPCHYGMLVFNVAPAAKYEPYSYDIYEDAYAYSDNKGLCVLYPSYTGIQTSAQPMWNPNDLTDQTVGLGDTPTKISSRVVKMPGTKDMDPKRGGDFVIMREGNFYNPGYYKHLQSEIHRWPGDMKQEEMELALQALVESIEQSRAVEQE